MRRTYSLLAWVVAGGVFVQAMALAFGAGGEHHFIQEGGVVDKALIESQTADYTGAIGIPVHGIVGGMVIPLAAIALLVLSFLVRVPGGRKWAAILFGLVLVQAMLGYSIKDVPYLGILHGGNALAVLLTAIHAARLPGRAEQPSAGQAASSRVAV